MNYRQVPNFNLIPPEYRRTTTSISRILLRLLLVIVIAIEALFIQTLYQEKLILDADAHSIQQKIQHVEESLTIVNAEREEAKELETAIEALRQEHQALEDDLEQLRITQPDWPQVLDALFQSKCEGVQLSMVKLNETQVNATGAVPNYMTLIKYRNTLLTSPTINRIVSLVSTQSESSIFFSLVAEVEMGGK